MEVRSFSVVLKRFRFVSLIVFILKCIHNNDLILVIIIKSFSVYFRQPSFLP